MPFYDQYTLVYGWADDRSVELSVDPELVMKGSKRVKGRPNEVREVVVGSKGN